VKDVTQPTSYRSSSIYVCSWPVWEDETALTSRQSDVAASYSCSGHRFVSPKSRRPGVSGEDRGVDSGREKTSVVGRPGTRKDNRMSTDEGSHHPLDAPWPSVCGSRSDCSVAFWCTVLARNPLDERKPREH
jgi:hypothetical protein